MDTSCGHRPSPDLQRVVDAFAGEAPFPRGLRQMAGIWDRVAVVCTCGRFIAHLAGGSDGQLRDVSGRRGAVTLAADRDRPARSRLLLRCTRRDCRERRPFRRETLQAAYRTARRVGRREVSLDEL